MTERLFDPTTMSFGGFTRMPLPSPAPKVQPEETTDDRPLSQWTERDLSRALTSLAIVLALCKFLHWIF